MFVIANILVRIMKEGSLRSFGNVMRKSCGYAILLSFV